MAYVYIGGIAGQASGNISFSTNEGWIKANSTKTANYVYAGGIAGNYTSGIMNFCENKNLVNASSLSASEFTNDHYAGGIVGKNAGIIINCSNKANVGYSDNHKPHATRPYCYIGGIAGSNINTGKIINCNNMSSNMQATADCNAAGQEKFIYCGGISGTNAGTITNSYSISTYNLTANKIYKGGIAGNNTGTLINNYYLSGVAATATGLGLGTATAVSLAACTDDGTLNQYLNDYVNTVEDEYSYSSWIIKDRFPDLSGVFKTSYSIDYQIQGNGSINIPASAIAGERVFLSIIPDKGHQFVDISIPGLDQVDSIRYSFIMPDNPINIVITFHASISIETSETSVNIIWLPIPEAENYILTIYDNENYENPLFDLYFDADGQLTGNQKYITDRYATADAINVFSHNVTGLSSGMTYYYSLSSGDQTLSGMFTTDGFPTSLLLNMAGNIHIYPNPASDIIFLKGFSANETVTISNSSGQILMTKDASVSHIDIKALPKGLYFVCIGKHVCKLIKK